MLRATSLSLLLVFVLGITHSTGQAKEECTLNSFPGMMVETQSCRLTDKHKDHLKKLAETLREAAKSNCLYAVTLVGHPKKDSASKERVSCRVDGVVSYLIQREGISKGRLNLNLDSGTGNEDLIEFKLTKTAINK